MASESSRTDEIVDEKLEEKKEADDINKLGGEENTVTYSATVSEEKPESKNVSIVEGLEKTNVKDQEVEDEIGTPEEQKKESSDEVVVPDVSAATVNEDFNAPFSSTEVSVNDLQVQSAFPEEKITETVESSSDGATINIGDEEKDSGDAEAVQKKEESLEKEISDNPLETLEAETEGAAEVPSDQGEAPKTAEIVGETDVRFNSDKEGIEATVQDPNIVPETSEAPFKNKQVSASDEKKSESLKDVDASSVNAPKDFATVEESIEQLIEENKNEKEVPAETSNDFETPEFAAEQVKDIGSSDMVEEKKNDSKDQSVVEKNVQIPDDKKEETQTEEAIQIATDKSEKKELGAEKEESEKSKDAVDPIVSSDTADTKLIKETTKRESNSLVSKVKRSIVKAKKAILGKSPGPKAVSVEIKDDNT